MGDSDLSASDLRRRYHRGGTAKDDELSSAQLRAKYAIPGNRKDFSTNDEESERRVKGSSTMMVAATVGVLVLLALAAYFIFSAKN
jgi:hypothetical protein